MKMITLSKEAVHSGSLILVNSRYPCHESAGENSLVPVDEKNPAALLERQSARLLDKLIDEVGGRDKILAVSGWRSKKEQAKIYDDSLAGNGRLFTEKYVAPPGFSEHQTGLAIDLAQNKPDIDFICPEFPYEGIYRKFRDIAPIYGFVERYPEGGESITGIGWEPWHFRYVGFPHSAIMKQHGMTLEEYHLFLKKYAYGKNPFVYTANCRRIEISYLRAKRNGLTQISVEDGVICSVSGNNTDGFFVTVWG